MTILALLIFLGCAVLYLAPTIISRSRNTRAHTGIALLNLFLGWTVLGWIAALIWAASAETEDQARMREMMYQHFAQTASVSIPQPTRTAGPSNAVAVGRAVGSIFSGSEPAGGTSLGLSGEMKPIVRE